MHHTSLLEAFERNLIEKYNTQIHLNARIAFGEDKFWDVSDPYSPVGSGSSYEAFHLFIAKSKGVGSEKEALREILKELDLVDNLIEVTQLKNENLVPYLEIKENRTTYVEVDYVIIACTFAQIVKYGNVSDGFMKLFIISILRQLNPILNEFVCNGEQDEITLRCDLIEDLSKFIVNIVKAVR